MRDQRLDRQDAVVFAQVANTLLRAVDGAEFERRLEALEKGLLDATLQQKNRTA
jgi:hypothetical protein